jgi:general secretion pathway protein A
MYLSHYNLNKIPFSISPDANLFWLGEKHTEALATLKYGIYENKGFLVLTGDVGTGKTALINRLLRDIDVPVLIATISDPGLDGIDFFNYLASEFKLKGKFNTKGNFLIQFKKFLLQANAANKKVLLIIDEVQRLNPDLLEQVRLLSNIEMNNKKLINIFFVGQNEFNNTLMMKQNEATRQRIAVRYHLKPLTANETNQYISYRLKTAGAARQIFESEAIKQVYFFSRGYPRLINIICDRCLLTGYSRDLQSISGSIVKECAKEIQFRAVRKRPQNRIQALPRKEEKKKPKEKTSESPFGIMKVAAAVLLIFLFGINGDWPFESRSETLPISENVISSVEKNKHPMEARENSLTPSYFAEENSNSDKENADKTPEKKYSKHSKALVYFNHDSNELYSQSLQDLNSFSKLVLQNPDSNIIVEGYTDSSGSSRYNRKLSKFRAEIVKNYLIAKGISPSKIEAFGLGSENPIASNDTSVGRGKNRRVEIRFATN